MMFFSTMYYFNINVSSLSFGAALSEGQKQTLLTEIFYLDEGEYELYSQDEITASENAAVTAKQVVISVLLVVLGGIVLGVLFGLYAKSCADEIAIMKICGAKSCHYGAFLIGSAALYTAISFVASLGLGVLLEIAMQTLGMTKPLDISIKLLCFAAFLIVAVIGSIPAFVGIDRRMKEAVK